MPKQTVRDLDVRPEGAGPRRFQRAPDGRRRESPTIGGSAAALPTLTSILDRGGSLILVSHLGRPTGDPAADAPFRLDPVAARLQELIVRPVQKVHDTVGPEAEAACAGLQPGGIVVLENVRFNKGEKKGDPEFAKQTGGAGGLLRQRRVRHVPPRRSVDGGRPRAVPTRSPGDRLPRRERAANPRHATAQSPSTRMSP